METAVTVSLITPTVLVTVFPAASAIVAVILRGPSDALPRLKLGTDHASAASADVDATAPAMERETLAPASAVPLTVTVDCTKARRGDQSCGSHCVFDHSNHPGCCVPSCICECCCDCH
jgi:hypothetical protein